MYKVCRECEYRGTKRQPNGFRECWGALADATPHVLDLCRVGQIGTKTFPDPIPPLLRSGRASLLDLTQDELGKEGAYRVRRLMQWEHSRDGGTEFIDPSLVRILRDHATDPGYPLHFVDFEACNVALPHHGGLRPYERVAFQWSCHTVHQSGELTHAEWLNVDREFPNFAFVKTLRQALGDRGTIYVWSPYEQTTLRNVLTQLEEWIARDPEEAARVAQVADVGDLESLADWLNGLLGHEDEKGRRHSSRIRDLHDLALKYYFHPDMGGRTSIKVVLPAIWKADHALGTHPWFTQYLKTDGDGQPLDPYEALEPLPLGDGGAEEDVVREGTGAIRAYQDFIFRAEAEPQARANLQHLLLQYCGLDTAAMVMIWVHWTKGSLIRGGV